MDNNTLGNNIEIIGSNRDFLGWQYFFCGSHFISQAFLAFTKTAFFMSERKPGKNVRGVSVMKFGKNTG